jgi:hypothetical protein
VAGIGGSGWLDWWLARCEHGPKRTGRSFFGDSVVPSPGTDGILRGMASARWLPALVVVLALTLASPSLAGTVSGSVTGLPAGVTPLGVEALNSHGVIGAIGPLTGSGGYHLTLPAGTWIFVGTATSGDEPFTSLSAPVRVRAHGSARAPATPAKQEASAASAARLKPGSVVTVDRVTLEDERVFTGLPTYPDYTATVTNDLFRACAAHGITFVDSSSAFTRFAKQESNLSRSGRLATPFDFRPIRWQYEVAPANSESIESSAGVIGTNEIDMQLSINLAGSQLSAGRSFRVPNLVVPFATTPDAQDILGVVHREDAAIARKMC